MHKLIDTIDVGDEPRGVAVNPTTNRIYVTNAADDTVSVIDGTTNTVIATVNVGDNPVAVAVNPTTNRIYVANTGLGENDGTVSVIDGTTNTVIATVAVGNSPQGVAVNPATNRIYVANNIGDTVSVIDDNVVVNQPPTANAGPDQTVNEGATVTLDGSGSSDPDGDALTYAWTQTAGPSVTLDDASSATPSFTAPDVGADGDTLTFELTVDDGNGHTATDTVNIQINDNPPPPATEYTIKGFYAPVDMEDSNGDPIVNTIKSGRTVALKFEVFDQNNVEQTSTDVVESFEQNRISCSTLQGESQDAIEVTSTGGTNLRYDTSGGTFIQNWKTPSGQAGSCYSVTVTTTDGSSITAYFSLIR